MEEATEFKDWELLHVPDSVIPAPAISAHASATGEDCPPRAGGDSDGVIRPTYLGLNTENWYAYPRRSSCSDGDRDDLDRVDPYSGSGFLEEPPREGLGLAAAKFPRPGLGGLWTPDESSGGQETPLNDHAKDELESSVGSRSELVLDGVNSNGGEGEGNGAYLGETEEIGVVEPGSDVSGELDSASDTPNAITVPLEFRVERKNGDGDLQNLTVAKVGKAGMVWWKLPMEILKFCVFRIRPVWSISVAAALAGILILGSRLYKKKSKSRSIPLKLCVGDKKVPQSMVRAIRLNEVFSVAKQVPVIRSTLPTAGLTSWPVVALR